MTRTRSGLLSAAWSEALSGGRPGEAQRGPLGASPALGEREREESGAEDHGTGKARPFESIRSDCFCLAWEENIPMKNGRLRNENDQHRQPQSLQREHTEDSPPERPPAPARLWAHSHRQGKLTTRFLGCDGPARAPGWMFVTFGGELNCRLVSAYFP